MTHRRVKILASVLVAIAAVASGCTGGGGGGPAPLQIVSDALPTFVLNQNVSAPLVTSGGVPPITWSISEGTLPVGIALEPTSGVINGAPSAVGSSSVIVTATDSRGATDTRFLPAVVQSDGVPQVSGDPLGEGSEVSFVHGSGGPAGFWNLAASSLSRTRMSWADLADRFSVFGQSRSHVLERGLGGTGPVIVRETRHGATVAVLDPRTDNLQATGWFSPNGAYLALLIQPAERLSELRVYRTSNWELVRTISDVGYEYIWAPTSDRLVGSYTYSGPTRIVGAADPALDREVTQPGFMNCAPVMAWLKTDRLVRTCNPVGQPTRYNLVTSRASDGGDARAVLTCDLDQAFSCRRSGMVAFSSYAAGSPTGNRIAVGAAAVASFAPPDTLVSVEDVDGASPTVLVTPTPGQFVIRWRVEVTARRICNIVASGSVSG